MNARFVLGAPTLVLLLWLSPGVAVRAQQHSHPASTPPPVPPVTRPAAQEATAVDHSTMDHSTMDHSTMDHSTTDPGDPAPRPTPASLPPPTPAERAAAFPEVAAHSMNDDAISLYVLANRLEAWDTDPGIGLHWSGQAWIGTDTRRLWLRSEGERIDGHTESADLEAFYGQSLSPWWELLLGVREDFAPGDARTWLAIGVMGMAPQKFDIAATAYVGPSGRTAVRVDVDYDLLLGERWVLQPRLEANLYGDSDAGRGLGSGLSTAEGGAWLRYDVTPRFAPFCRVVRQPPVGETARASGGPGANTGGRGGELHRRATSGIPAPAVAHKKSRAVGPGPHQHQPKKCTVADPQCHLDGG